LWKKGSASEKEKEETAMPHRRGSERPLVPTQAFGGWTPRVFYPLLHSEKRPSEEGAKKGINVSNDQLGGWDKIKAKRQN